MKKYTFLTVLLATTSLLTLASCGSSSSNDAPIDTPSNVNITPAASHESAGVASDEDLSTGVAPVPSDGSR